MAAKENEIDRDKELVRLTKELEDRFRRWDHLAFHGGSDPFWADGVNMNLVRNHIIFCKREIEKLVQEGSDELSLFGVEYPDIYLRETPPQMFDHHMVKAAEIKQRAAEQLALYESDPNFQYCLQNHDKVFSNGETKATKSAGLSIWSTAGLGKYRKSFESGDLVAMRRDFREDYKVKAARWAEYARVMKAFLEKDHSLDDNTPVRDEFDDENIEQQNCCSMDNEEWTRDNEGVDEYFYSSTISNRYGDLLSLDEQIKNAKDKGSVLEKPVIRKEEQLSLF